MVAAKQKPGSPFITPERLRELFGMMLRFHAAQSDTRKLFKSKKWSSKLLPSLSHPAMLAGCFAHLRAGDLVAPASYEFAANLAVGAPLGKVLQRIATRNAEAATKSLRLPAAESLALIAGAAQALKLAGQHATVVAVLGDQIPGDPEVAPLLKWCAGRRLPLILLTVSREFPQPGAIRAPHGIPQIAVGVEDAPAIYRVMQESIHRARTGVGPTWIRCVGSITAGAASRRSAANPFPTMRTFLETRGYYDSLQSRRESLRWTSEWKAAQKQMSPKPNEETPELPVHTFDPFR